MKKFLLLPAILLVVYGYYNTQHSSIINSAQSIESAEVTSNSDASLANAFSNHISNIQVTGQGVVIKLLPDDSSGSRHQKFIIKLVSGQTLLVAHNIDLAPKINAIRKGDLIEFTGEYEWNNKGGVLHWTHLDPNGSHVGGWLKHDGKIYQ